MDAERARTSRRAALAATLGCIAFAFVLWLTRPLGPGLTPDGMSYLGAAESWAAGHGLRVPYNSWDEPDSTAPLRVFPPGFPLAVGVVMKAGAAPITAARLVMAVGAGVTVATIASLLEVLAGTAAALLGAAVILIPALAGDYISVLSEPLFLACLAIGLSAMITSPDRPLRFGLAAAAAALTRYAGLPLALAAVLWAAMHPGPRRGRLMSALLAALPTLVLFGAWAVRTRTVARALPARFVSPELPVLSVLKEVRASLAPTLAPALGETRWQLPVAAVTLILILLLILLLIRNTEARAQTKPVLQLVAVFSACYLAFLIFARAFVGHGIPFDERILSPIVLVVALIAILSLTNAWPRWAVPLRTFAGIAGTAWLLGALMSLKEVARDVRTNGYDYGNLTWQGSSVLGWLRNGAAGRAIFTNNSVPIYFHLHRPSRDIPASISPDTIRAFDAVLAGQPAVFVAFDDTSWEPEAWAAAVASRVRLKEVARLNDGVIWVTVRGAP